MARYWLRMRRFVMHNVLHADDTPHSIALGTAIAVFIAILPLVGIQMFLSVAVAALFGFSITNRQSGAEDGSITDASHPITTGPFQPADTFRVNVNGEFTGLLPSGSSMR